jgi:hypothetical protein
LAASPPPKINDRRQGTSGKQFVNQRLMLAACRPGENDHADL